jgi:LysM repeat protein
LLAWGLCGCLPGGDSQADEEREPHFLMGRKLASQMDYDGAVDAYEKALLVNPQSAAAHFELAWLYEGKQNDPAAAIYHYERFLKLAPNSGKADVAQAHINNCKLELAKTASAIAPISASAQRDLEKLVQENRDLKAQLAYYASHPGTSVSNPPVPPPVSNPIPLVTVTNPSRTTAPSDTTAVRTPPPAPNSRPPAPPPAKTHTVSSGETMAAVARKFGVTLDALRAANPQVADPRHLRVGTTLNIPGA